MISIHNAKYETPSKPWDFKVCRGASILGNPFVIGPEHGRDDVCDLYEKYLEEKSQVEGPIKDELYKLLDTYKRYGILRLFCYCTPLRCHAELIKMWIEDRL